ncbi:hypothetical protein H4R34_004809 [Dimargaris verticillata]|uniref:Major facilitator superfamily (MFS) profile domain-containing protein n=1 Tax=Dimargaris verticillata TaxID=2761393 RepID=A0A9W8AXL6_9FUNG|nr:hypothetical protein H4R34_004809 [Dimargaris verticillata]
MRPLNIPCTPCPAQRLPVFAVKPADNGTDDENIPQLPAARGSQWPIPATPVASLSLDRRGSSASCVSPVETAMTPPVSATLLSGSVHQVYDSAQDLATMPTWQRYAMLGMAFTAAAMTPLIDYLGLAVLPTVGRAWHLTVTQQIMLEALPLTGMTLGPIVWGPLADSVGRRVSYAAGALICTVASIGCALATNAVTLSVCRFVQTVGGSALAIAAFGTAKDLTALQTTDWVAGGYLASHWLGLVLGTVVGSTIAQTVDWAWAFWVISILAWLAWLVFIALMPETRPNPRPVYQLSCHTTCLRDVMLIPSTRSQSTGQALWRQLEGFWQPLQQPATARAMGALALALGSFHGCRWLVVQSQAGHLPQLSITPLVMLGLGMGGLIGTVAGQSLKRQPRCSSQGAYCIPITTKGVHASRQLRQMSPASIAMFGYFAAMVAYGWATHSQPSAALPIIALLTVFHDLLAASTRPDSSLVALQCASSGLYAILWSGLGPLALQVMQVGWAFTVLAATSGLLAIILWVACSAPLGQSPDPALAVTCQRASLHKQCPATDQHRSGSGVREKATMVC